MNDKLRGKLAQRLNALANSKRLQIIELLQSNEVRELNVNELADKLEIAPSTLSNHLTRLRNADFVEVYKEEGTNNFYRSNNENILVALQEATRLLSA